MSTANHEGEGAHIFEWASMEWDRPGEGPGPKAPEALIEAAKKTGAVRKKVVQGEGGFFMNRSCLPAGFRVPPHQHNHDELIVVLAGGCEFDDGVGGLTAEDSVVINAGFRYGFTCGEDGMEFLTIRTADATTSLSD